MIANDGHDQKLICIRRIFRFVTENESLIIFYYIRLKSDIPMKSDNHIYNRKSDDSSSIWPNPFLGLYLGTKVPFTNLSHDEDSRYWSVTGDNIKSKTYPFLNFENFKNYTFESVRGGESVAVEQSEFVVYIRTEKSPKYLYFRRMV